MAASAKLCALRGKDPDYIYVPEVPFDISSFLDKAIKTYQEKGHCIIVLSEGIRNREGKLISDSQKDDAFGNRIVGMLKNNWNHVQEKIEDGTIVAAWAVGFGGVAEGLCKMSFGNAFGFDVNLGEEDLFNLSYGSIIVETDSSALDFPNAIEIGKVTDGEDGNVRINGTKISIFELMDFNASLFDKVYPSTCRAGFDKVIPDGMEGIKPYKAKKADLKYKGPAVDEVIAYLPVFPGTNCDYDSAKAFRKAGATVRTSVFRNLTDKDVFESIDEMKKNIDECHILMISGGFSAGDEPDGSGKFIANVLNNKTVAEAIENLIARGGLILGICNGFQALVKSGLLPYGHLGMVTEDSPTLFRNDINRHISPVCQLAGATDSRSGGGGSQG